MTRHDEYTRTKMFLHEIMMQISELASGYYELGDIGIAVSVEMLRFMMEEAREPYAPFLANYDGRSKFKYSGLDVYPVLDSGHFGCTAAPIILSERYAYDIPYKNGVLIVRNNNKVYRVSNTNSGDPLGLGVVPTGYRIDAETQCILPDGEAPQRNYAEGHDGEWHPVTAPSWSFSMRNGRAWSGPSWQPKAATADGKVTDEFDPTPELDRLLASIAQKEH